MSDRCDKIEKDLDDFKDAYVKNNKEFLQLSFYVGEVRDAVKDHIQRTEDYKKEREAREGDYHQIIEKKLLHREEGENEYQKSIKEKLSEIEEKIQPLTNLSIASQILYKFALGVAGLIIAIAGAYFAVKKFIES